MTTFSLKIITPEKIFYDGEIVQIGLTTKEGNIGIMAGHVPYVANLVPSSLKIKEKDGEEFRVAAVAGGMVKMSGNEAVVVTSAVEWAEDIDLPRAQHAKEVAQNRIAAAKNDERELMLAEAKLRRALVRIGVKS